MGIDHKAFSHTNAPTVPDSPHLPCWRLTARGNLVFIAKQMGHKDFPMLVEVYAKWMDDESPTELQRIWAVIQNQGK